MNHIIKHNYVPQVQSLFNDNLIKIYNDDNDDHLVFELYRTIYYLWEIEFGENRGYNSDPDQDGSIKVCSWKGNHETYYFDSNIEKCVIWTRGILEQ